jgi:ABC-type antimicrobial peptide transport system permease subunit
MKSTPGFLSVVNGLTLSPLLAALTLAIGLLIGLASAVVPALNAARTSIVEALEYNG